MTIKQNIIPIHIETELKSSFLDYSMSVIVSRALPDVRDGMKPVHRRILFAMYGLKNFFNRPYLKSARIVGDVIGRYHPHGDSSVYEALVRLAQDFSMRYPLVDGQGNFGSIDGDSAAAMRYTESRLGEIASLMLADLDKDTVDFGPNYDNKETEPLVLPTKLPQLLINGASGIAVGMATNMAPHNLSEVASALEAMIDDPDISLAELMTHIKGPDFPTSAMIYGRAGIIEAYQTGRGSVVMRAKAHVEDMPGGRERIVVTELPYQIIKSRLIERIAELVHEKKIEGISDIRDESAKNEIRIVIELRKGEIGEILLNNLYKMTPLQSSFGINNVALVHGVPKLLPLKDLLWEFYKHRREVIVRRTVFELRKADERSHILLGLKKAVEEMDEVVKTIRESVDVEVAQEQLIANFQLSAIQAKAILDMRLARLTGLEREKIVQEYEEVQKTIADLNDILNRPERVTAIIKQDILELKEQFGDVRRTEIVATNADELTMEKLVADEEVAVIVTVAGYVKRTPIDQIQAQKRGGKGRAGMLTREEDVVKDIFISSNHQSLLVFTNKGKVYHLKVYEVPEVALRGRGKHFANLVQLEESESVVSVLPVREFHEGSSVISVTTSGYIKKTDLMAYANVRRTGIIGLKLDEGDALVSCGICKTGDHIILATSMGKSVRFEESDTRPMGRAARGVTGIRFGGVDRVVGMEILSGETKDVTLLTVCENGYGKRTELDEYRVQSRGGKGIVTIKVSDRNGPVVGLCRLTDEDDVLIITSTGKIMRARAKEISIVGRNTQGVRLMNIESGEKVISFCRSDREEDAETLKIDSSAIEEEPLEEDLQEEESAESNDGNEDT
jgi:DNA gyrase subunit A